MSPVSILTWGWFIISGLLVSDVIGGRKDVNLTFNYHPPVTS